MFERLSHESAPFFPTGPIRLLTVCLLIVLPLGCGGGDIASESGLSGDPIKIGAIFDLTGPTADVGTTYSEGIRGYVDWLNDNEGIGGRPVDLLWQDYAYKVDQAEQLYSQYVGEGVVTFMGWGTADTEALSGRIADDQIPFMSASLSHVLGDPEEAPYNFLSGTSYTHQLMIVLDWLLQQDPAIDQVAMMHHPSPFGLSPYQQGGEEYARSRGIELVPYEMPRGATDYTAQLTRIVDSGARHVLFQTTSAPVATALNNAQELGLDLWFGCLNWCSNEVLTELAGGAAEGVVGSILFAPAGEGITGAFEAQGWLQKNSMSLEDKGLLYLQGWVTMKLMTEGIRRAASRGEVTGATVKAALETLENYSTGGVTAPVTYTPENHRGMKGMRLYEVRDGKWTQLTGLLFAPGTGPASSDEVSDGASGETSG